MDSCPDFDRHGQATALPKGQRDTPRLRAIRHAAAAGGDRDRRRRPRGCTVARRARSDRDGVMIAAVNLASEAPNSPPRHGAAAIFRWARRDPREPNSRPNVAGAHHGQVISRHHDTRSHAHRKYASGQLGKKKQRSRWTGPSAPQLHQVICPPECGIKVARLESSAHCVRGGSKADKQGWRWIL
jgi:hypothetical protein